MKKNFRLEYISCYLNFVCEFLVWLWKISNEYYFLLRDKIEKHFFLILWFKHMHQAIYIKCWMQLKHDLQNAKFYHNTHSFFYIENFHFLSSRFFSPILKQRSKPQNEYFFMRIIFFKFLYHICLNFFFCVFYFF